MILSTTSTDRPVCSEPFPTESRFNPAMSSRSDEVSTERTNFLRSELKRQPAVRPEVVARARALVADPNYPPMETLRKVAAQILAAPDLSEEEV